MAPFTGASGTPAVLVEVDPLPKVRARAGGLRWLGANESLQPACDTCGQIPKLAHARGVACPLCHVGCTLERDQLVALSTGASREALLSGGALLPRGVFAQSRNTRLLASGMCFERAAFIHCLASKRTDRYHRTKACRATCLHPRYEVHHPAKTFASGVKLDQVTRYPLSPPILACGATLSCWLPLSRASKSFLFRQRSDDECASHPLNPPELWGEVLRSHSKLRSITVCAPRVPRLSSRARSVSSAAIAAARGASSSGVSIARSVRSVHRRRGASVTVSRASRTARARPARLRHSCCLLRARQPSGRSGSTSTLLTASTERPHPLLPSGKHRAWCRRLASEYAVPVRQINLVFCKTQSTKRKTSSFC